MSSMEEIRAQLRALANEEEEINSGLDGLLKEKNTLEGRLLSLQKMMPNLGLIHNDAKQLTGMISFTSQLADNVSGKVRQLDLAKSRVLAASLRVEDILDLKFCTEGVQTALHEESYEKAAALIHRFLSMDEAILQLSADAAEGSGLKRSFTTLREAEAKLKAITHSKFDAAVTAGDVASVERFFKIFPLLEIKEEGLTKFARWHSAQLSEEANKRMTVALAMQSTDKRATLVFSDLLESLFESIAKVIELHQPLIETKYGHGWMFTFAKSIQKECDRQSRKIMEEFRNRRKFDSIISSIQEGLTHTHTVVERLEPKSLDALLGEMTLMNSKCELYLRFLKRRVATDMEFAGELTEERKAEIEDLVRRCDLSKEMQVVVGYYIMMEEYYMREMADKAAALDTSDSSSLTSSVVDDTFYLVKKSIRRALSSASIDGVCAVINHACSVLDEKFIELLKSRLKLGYPSGALSQAYNIVSSSFQQGKLQSSDVEKSRLQFLMTLNNAEASSENIQTLKNSIESELPKVLSSDSKNTDEKLDSCLTDLGHLTKRFKDLVDFGFNQLRSSAIKSRIKPSIEDLLSTSHNIDEETFSEYEASDPWIQNFIVVLDGFLKAFQTSLTPANYDKFISQLTAELTLQMEKAVFKLAFNRLGGLQFDKELRSLLGYLTNVTTWTIRDKFARLTQMATILNLEKVSEILDYWGSNSGPVTWRLTPSEVRQVLALRLDFTDHEIRQLKL
ncbi:conserved oligomeric Golgi complex subunit 4-like isoform X2 [Watersipora subatra]|uniref:conserved oligomeric Golgi complex subunit 4-like isoform X2 n=1 Tax=Watersipora subatra TaxID=2589382 RepID=UPI00355C59BB